MATYAEKLTKRFFLALSDADPERAAAYAADPLVWSTSSPSGGPDDRVIYDDLDFTEWVTRMRCAGTRSICLERIEERGDQVVVWGTLGDRAAGTAPRSSVDRIQIRFEAAVSFDGEFVSLVEIGIGGQRLEPGPNARKVVRARSETEVRAA
jgi:hypothetical protein